MKNTIFISAFVLSLLSAVSATLAGTITGTVTARGVRSARDVVVYIERAEGDTASFKPSEEHAVIDQKNLVFIPHVLPVLVGTTVDFPNSDDVRHNVFSPPGSAKQFNLGIYPAGVTKSVTFDTLGEVTLLCNVHTEMSAFIIVLENPYFDKTGRDGKFVIENIPAGEYKIKTWHERLRSETQEITVPEEGEVAVDFKLRR